VQEFQIGGTSARFSKFVIQRGTLGHELRKPKGTSNSMILVPLFDLKFLRRTRGTRCRNFKSAALDRTVAKFARIFLARPQAASYG
jgi:hypothetical protein